MGISKDSFIFIINIYICYFIGSHATVRENFQISAHPKQSMRNVIVIFIS